MHLVPPLVVFGIVMGSLYFGIATATESAALGVIAALFFVWHSGKLNREVLRTCFISTARVSGMILLIIVGGVHPEPHHQPDRRGRGDDQVGGGPGLVGHRR